MMLTADSGVIGLAESIATLSLDKFDKLPTKCKPRTLPEGQSEWTPMSAIVLSRPSMPKSGAESGLIETAVSSQVEEIEIVALATGTKSLPFSVLPKCKGLVLHDCHAEILALRGLNFWLLKEVKSMLEVTSGTSNWLEWQASKIDVEQGKLPFRLHKGVEISLFSTEAPCGDASMETLIADQLAAGRDITPWPDATNTNKDFGSDMQGVPLGRGNFSQLGALRRKPARADAEISMSKSCTDKITTKQLTSLLCFPLDLLIENNAEAFLKRIIIYKDQFHETGYRRAFSSKGRLKNVLANANAQCTAEMRFFDIEQLPPNFRRFQYEKQRSLNLDNSKSKVTNLSTVWIAGNKEREGDEIIEVLINGVKQGFRQSSDKEGKGSVLCRHNMVQDWLEVIELLQARGSSVPSFQLDNRDRSTYTDLKSLPSRMARQRLKKLVLDALGGWPEKPVEDDFEIVMSNFSDQSQSRIACFLSFHPD